MDMTDPIVPDLQDEVRRIVESRSSLPPRNGFERRNESDALVQRLMRAINDHAKKGD